MKMSENLFFSSGFAAVTSIFIILVITILLIAGANQHGKEEYERGYQTGYVQALKDNHAGSAKYKLVEKPDGTKNWELIKNEK